MVEESFPDEYAPVPFKGWLGSFGSVVEGTYTSRDFKGILVPICPIGGVSATSFCRHIMSLGRNSTLEYCSLSSFDPDINFHWRIGFRHVTVYLSGLV
jgi:hypothetical protein